MRGAVAAVSCLALFVALGSCGGPAFSSAAERDAEAEAMTEASATWESSTDASRTDGSSFDAAETAAETSFQPGEAGPSDATEQHESSPGDAGPADIGTDVKGNDGSVDAPVDVEPPVMCVSPQGFGCSQPWPVPCPNGYCCNRCQ